MHRLTKVVLLTAIFALPGCTSAAEEKPAVDPGMVRIEEVEVRGTLVGAVVLLKAESKAIPVFVDATVAESIASALSGGKPCVRYRTISCTPYWKRSTARCRAS